jgi:hypothetical protein
MIIGCYKGTKMRRNKPERAVFLMGIILLSAITYSEKSGNFRKTQNSLYNYPRIQKRKTINCE